jgi:hypothetical protein
MSQQLTVPTADTQLHIVDTPDGLTVRPRS